MQPPAFGGLQRNRAKQTTPIKADPLRGRRLRRRKQTRAAKADQAGEGRPDGRRHTMTAKSDQPLARLRCRIFFVRSPKRAKSIFVFLPGAIRRSSRSYKNSAKTRGSLRSIESLRELKTFWLYTTGNRRCRETRILMRTSDGVRSTGYTAKIPTTAHLWLERGNARRVA